MHISSALVGQKLKTFQHTVNWRETTNYAAGTGDMNPCYVDDAREEGIIAPPLYAVALSWPILERIEDYLQSDFDASILKGKLHFKEQIQFFRPIRPGDTVIIEGEIAAIKPHKAGTELIIKLPVADSKGDLYHIEYIGALLRGVSCEGEGRIQDDYPDMPPSLPLPDNPIWEKIVYIPPEAPYIYDGCSQIFFEIHTSPKFAKQVGLPGIILQGTATMAIAVRELVNREMGSDPLNLKAVAIKFTGMVFPGSNIRVQLLHRKPAGLFTDLHFRVVKDNEEEVVKGYIRADSRI